MADNIITITEEGYKKLTEELEYLRTTKRNEVRESVKVARSFGDLSENAEYDAAKEAQGMLEMKIAQLKDLVANARIIDETKLTTDEVQLMSVVTIKNLKNNATQTYTIVADSEANLREMKISTSTPIAKGLMGHKVGDIVEITVPAGVMKFEIVEISI